MCRRTDSENIALVFSLLIRNFRKLLIVSLLFTAPSIIVQILDPFDPVASIFLDATTASQVPVHGLSALLFLILLPLLLGSVFGIVMGSDTGERVSIAGSLALAGHKYAALTIYGSLHCALLLACWCLGMALDALFAATCVPPHAHGEFSSCCRPSLSPLS